MIEPENESLSELEPELAQALTGKRPDPAFRYSLGLIAERLKAELLDPKLPQSMVADAIMYVPRGIKTEGSIGDFLETFSIFEFKGENDSFNEVEFVKTEIRTALVFVTNKKATFENLLNVIVTAKNPTSFFKYMSQRGFDFKPDQGREWQLRYRVGLQQVVIIICSKLPVEEKYLEWLIFAPSKTKRWREAIREIVRLGKWELYNRVEELKPKEVAAMSAEFRKLLDTESSPREKKRLERDRAAAGRIYLEYFKEYEPEIYDEIVRDEIIAKLKPEDRLAGLKPEDRLAGLKPEDREELLKLLTGQIEKE